MELRRTRVSTSVRTEGGLLPADLLAKVPAGLRDVPGLADADYSLAAGDRVREAMTRSGNRLVGSWAALTAARIGAADEQEPLTTKGGTASIARGNRIVFGLGFLEFAGHSGA